LPLSNVPSAMSPRPKFDAAGPPSVQSQTRIRKSRQL